MDTNTEPAPQTDELVAAFAELGWMIDRVGDWPPIGRWMLALTDPLGSQVQIYSLAAKVEITSAGHWEVLPLDAIAEPWRIVAVAGLCAAWGREYAAIARALDRG